MHIILPASLGETLTARASFPGIVPMAGGTDLLVRWPGTIERHEASYLDLSGVPEMRAIRWTASHVEIGATATYWDTLSDVRFGQEFPMLQCAARQIGALQIQTRGTWGGNVANASPVADGVAALMAHDATVVLTSSEGERSVPLASFYRGYKDPRTRPNELIRSLIVPRRRQARAFFEEGGLAPGPGHLGALRRPVAHSVEGWRVVAGGMAPTVRRCTAVEGLLEAGSPIRAPEDLLAALDADVSPIDDVRGTARYRRQVMARVLYHGLREHRGRGD